MAKCKQKKLILPIGFKGVIKDDKNTQEGFGVKKGTKFEIVAHLKGSTQIYDYEVRFYPKNKFSKLNSEGPFIANYDIDLTRTAKILFGDT